MYMLGEGVDKRRWVHRGSLPPPKFRAGFRTQAVDEMGCLGRKKRCDVSGKGLW